MITFESTEENMPPVELMDNPLRIGDEVELWNGEKCEIIEIRGDLRISSEGTWRAFVLNRCFHYDGFYGSGAKVRSRINVRRVTRND